MANEPCKISDEDLVLRTARFMGSWTTRAATYCSGWKLPIDDYDKVVFEFRKRVSGSARQGMGRRPLATALVLETGVDEKLDGLIVKVGGETKTLQPLPAAACKRWIKGHESGKCVILLMGNPPVEPMFMGNPPIEQEDCPPGAACRIDSHFSAFYRVSLDPPMRINRWLPFVVTTDAQCPSPDEPGMVHPPAVRCPPPFGEVSTK
jgi:hypothetical protein